jgi:hypothetical protein
LAWLMMLLAPDSYCALLSFECENRKKSKEFFSSRVPVHTFDRQPVGKAAVTPSREEVAQARLLDVQHILSIWERGQGICLGRVERL